MECVRRGDPLRAPDDVVPQLGLELVAEAAVGDVVPEDLVDGGDERGLVDALDLVLGVGVRRGGLDVV